MNDFEFERGITINNQSLRHFISGEFISQEEILTRMNRVIKNSSVPFKFPRQANESTRLSAFHKLYYENLLMEIVRKLNSNPKYIARIVMGKVIVGNDFFKKIVRGNSDSLDFNSLPVRFGKTEITRNNIEKLINEMTQKALNRKNGEEILK